MHFVECYTISSNDIAMVEPIAKTKTNEKSSTSTVNIADVDAILSKSPYYKNKRLKTQPPSPEASDVAGDPPNIETSTEKLSAFEANCEALTTRRLRGGKVALQATVEARREAMAREPRLAQATGFITEVEETPDLDLDTLTCPYFDIEKGYVLSAGDHVDFHYHWDVVEKELPLQLQNKGLRQGDWVESDTFLARYRGYDEAAKKHIVEVSVKGSPQHWDVAEVRPAKREDEEALPNEPQEETATHLRMVKDPDGHILVQGFWPCREGSNGLTAASDSPEWQELCGTMDPEVLRHLVPTFERCKTALGKPFKMPIGSMPARNGDGAPQIHRPEGMSVEFDGPSFDVLSKSLFSRDDLCVARSYILVATAKGWIVGGDAVRLWDAVEAWAAQSDKHWCGIGNFNDAVLRQIGKHLGVKLPQLVRRPEVTNIATGKGSGCLLVVPVGTNHCVAVDLDAGLCWDPAAVETRAAIPMEGDWMARVAPGWNGWVTESYQIVKTTFATEVCPLCGAEVDCNVIESHRGSKACQKRQKKKKTEERKRKRDGVEGCSAAKAMRLA